jgi:hypothetical protein
MTLSIDSLRGDLPERPFEENTSQSFATTYDKMWENAYHEARYNGGTMDNQNLYDKNGNLLSSFTEDEDGFVREVFDEEGNHGSVEWKKNEDGTFTLENGWGYDSKHGICYQYSDTNGNGSFDEVNIYQLERDMQEEDFTEVEPRKYKKSIDENFQEFDIKVKE